MGFKIMSVFLAMLWLGPCNSKIVSQNPQGKTNITIEDFSFLNGEWEGTLEYLNYGDDKTFVTLPTRSAYYQEDDKIAYRLIFTEPGGEEIKREGSFRVNREHEILFNGASHFLVEHTEDLENGIFLIRFNRKGKDNDRDAQIDHIIKRNANKLSITRYVLLDGTDQSFIRHTYKFTRVF